MGILNDWFDPKDRSGNDNNNNQNNTDTEKSNVYEQDVAVAELDEEVDPIEYYGL